MEIVSILKDGGNDKHRHQKHLGKLGSRLLFTTICNWESVSTCQFQSYMLYQITYVHVKSSCNNTTFIIRPTLVLEIFT